MPRVTSEQPRPTWGPFDCQPAPYDVVAEDGTVYTITCNCGAEHPRLRFDRPLGGATSRPEL